MFAAIKLPNEWSAMRKDEDLNEVQVQPNTEEFVKITKMFTDTGLNVAKQTVSF